MDVDHVLRLLLTVESSGGWGVLLHVAGVENGVVGSGQITLRQSLRLTFEQRGETWDAPGGDAKARCIFPLIQVLGCQIHALAPARGHDLGSEPRAAQKGIGVDQIVGVIGQGDSNLEEHD